MVTALTSKKRVEAADRAVDQKHVARFARVRGMRKWPIPDRRGYPPHDMGDDTASSSSQPRAARVVIVGTAEPIGDALAQQVELLGWVPITTSEIDESVTAIDDLGANDAVVVLEHQHAVATPVLAAALRSDAGYVGAIGSRRMQAARVSSLRRAEIRDDELAALHCPSGLDLGAATPAESAVSIVAEIVATRSGRDPQPLRTTTNRISA
jgi:xanthine/CO dehydrogenase XdhC/CoxF family maturation factor